MRSVLVWMSIRFPSGERIVVKAINLASHGVLHVEEDREFLARLERTANHALAVLTDACVSVCVPSIGLMPFTVLAANLPLVMSGSVSLPPADIVATNISSAVMVKKKTFHLNEFIISS